MNKFQNKYRIPSARATFWDYGWVAEYFVTICTYNQVPYFGKIIDGEMTLSEIGEIVNKEWLKTFEIRPDMNLFMREFVIMPNHFHGIIGIGENKYNSEVDLAVKDAKHCVSTVATTQPIATRNLFGPQSKNLPSIIRGFKIGVTKKARLINNEFAWQSKYHDHIIRNDKSYNTISEYIIENPINWEKDKFYV